MSERKSDFVQRECAFLGNRFRFCEVTTRGSCQGCGFFRTQDELSESRRQALERLRQLPPEQQNMIEETYRVNISGGAYGEANHPARAQAPCRGQAAITG